MKKIVVFLMAICLSLAANAQLVSSSSLIVTKNAFPGIQPGWRSNIECNYKVGIDDYFYVGADYSFGYRFNKSFYLGIQAGMDYALEVEDYYSVIAPDAELYPSAINFPLCVDIRYFFPINRVFPFVQLNAGARLAPNKTAKYNLKEVEYGTSGILINPKLGLAYRITAKTDIYFSVGYCIQSRSKVGNIKGSIIEFSNPFYSSLSAHVGITF